MSTAQPENEFEELSKDLNIEVDDQTVKDSVLDLKTLGEHMVEDLKSFKTTRADMVTKRAALDKSIKIMDKRIEIVLSAIKTLQTPT